MNATFIFHLPGPTKCDNEQTNKGVVNNLQTTPKYTRFLGESEAIH